MRLKALSVGVSGTYFKDENVVAEIKEVMPHFVDYLDKWGVTGAAQLATPLRDSIFKSLQAALQSNDPDVANLVATREIVKLVTEYDNKLAEEATP